MLAIKAHETDIISKVIERDLARVRKSWREFKKLRPGADAFSFLARIAVTGRVVRYAHTRPTTTMCCPRGTGAAQACATTTPSTPAAAGQGSRSMWSKSCNQPTTSP